jgi:type VI secretion system protein
LPRATHWRAAADPAMELRLRIRNASALDNGSPTEVAIDQRGIVIGRSPTADWSLPDPRSYISSKHCEIVYTQGEYRLSDLSTNGTFVNGSPERLAGPRRLNDGDVITLGHYEIAVTLAGRNDRPAPVEPAASGGWSGWGSAPADPYAAPAPPGWGDPPARAEITGEGALSAHWAPPPAAAPAASGWDAPPAAGGSGNASWGPAPAAPAAPGESAYLGWEQASPPPTPASGWSSPGAAPSTPSAQDVWGRLEAGNVVDWARGGFGQPSPAPAPAVRELGLGGPAALAPMPSPAPAAPPPAAAAPASRAPSQPAAAPPGGGALEQLLARTDLKPGDIKTPPAETMAVAGALLRKLVAGLVVMVEARARAKAQLGAQTTSLQFDGNNPIKFARTPEQALQMLLNPPERGFMDGETAVDEAFFDLQAHQVATLKAMQGALRATLDRFSPAAIRRRAESGGLLQRIMPGAKEAALWQAYEREFGGVVSGSDEAFMDVFAKEFKRAYEAQATPRGRR